MQSQTVGVYRDEKTHDEQAFCSTAQQREQQVPVFHAQRRLLNFRARRWAFKRCHVHSPEAVNTSRCRTKQQNVSEPAVGDALHCACEHSTLTHLEYGPLVNRPKGCVTQLATTSCPSSNPLSSSSPLLFPPSLSSSLTHPPISLWKEWNGSRSL